MGMYTIYKLVVCSEFNITVIFIFNITVTNSLLTHLYSFMLEKEIKNETNIYFQTFKIFS